MILTLQSPFSAAHLYHQPLWDEDKNRAVFGACYTEHGHGHNYVLEVGFKIQSENWQQQRVKCDRLLKELTLRLDHRHLNFDIPEFKNSIPTTENIAVYFLEQLKQRIPAETISHLRLYETETIWTEIRL